VDQLLLKLERINKQLTESLDAQFNLEVILLLYYLTKYVVYVSFLIGDQVDRYVAVLEATRDLSHTWIHVDMDGLYLYNLSVFL
jgi:hypothetical protein